MTDTITKIAEERPHHPFSPSTLQYREACNTWTPRVTKELHERTVAGTKGHAVVDSGEDDPSLGDEDALAAAECVDFIDSRRLILDIEATNAFTEATLKAKEGNTPPPNEADYKVTELKEIHLAVDDLVFPDGTLSTTSGYTDHALLNWNKTYAELLDWKFGMWIVEDASNNVQGISYTLGLFREYPTLQSIRFFFKQPHLEHISDHTFFRADIPALYLRIQVIVNRSRRARELAAKGDWSMATPYVPVCNFCGDINACEKVCAFACKVSHKFMPLEFPENIDPAYIQDPVNMSKFLRFCQVMKVFAEGGKRWITDRIMRGDTEMLDGYKLESRQGRREIADLSRFKQVVLRFMTDEQYQKCLTATFGPLEEIITESAPRGEKTARVKEFGEALETAGAVSRKPGYSFLSVINDKTTEKK